jgi:hypothetical protein
MSGADHKYLRRGPGGGGKGESAEQRRERKSSFGLTKPTPPRKASRKISGKGHRNQKKKTDAASPIEQIMITAEGQRKPVLDHAAKTEQDRIAVYIDQGVGTLQNVEHMKEVYRQVSKGGKVTTELKEAIASIFAPAMNYAKIHLGLPVQVVRVEFTILLKPAVHYQVV